MDWPPWTPEGNWSLREPGSWAGQAAAARDPLPRPRTLTLTKRVLSSPDQGDGAEREARGGPVPAQLPCPGQLVLPQPVPPAVTAALTSPEGKSPGAPLPGSSTHEPLGNFTLRPVGQGLYCSRRAYSMEWLHSLLFWMDI